MGEALEELYRQAIVVAQTRIINLGDLAIAAIGPAVVRETISVRCVATHRIAVSILNRVSDWISGSRSI